MDTIPLDDAFTVLFNKLKKYPTGLNMFSDISKNTIDNIKISESDSNLLNRPYDQDPAPSKIISNKTANIINSANIFKTSSI